MAAHTVSAVVVPRNGGCNVLTVQPVEVDDPGPGEVQVQLAAAGVNFMDVYQRQGVYSVPTPFVLGSEGAGTVTAVGPTVTHISVGDVVAWPAFRGSAAELVDVPAAAVVPVPATVDPELAAASMLQGLTAHYLVNSTYPVQPGDWILLHAAAGGVGQLLIQLAKARGATVIATVSTEAKAEKARAAGADHIINYSEVTAIADRVRELTDGVGVAVAYDGVGKATFDESLKSVRIRGMLVLFGGASGQVPPFDLQRLNSGGSLYVTRPTLGHYIRTREELLERSDDLFTRIAAGELRLEIGGRYPFSEAAKAYDDLEGRKTTGKLLLVP
jgi:NADPH:quinone reductase